MNRYKLIVNPIAGGGKALKLLPRIEEKLAAGGVDFDTHITSCRGDATVAAKEAAEKGFNIVVAVGGDGTVNETLNGIAETGAALAAVHGGKGNDFCLSTRMPRNIDDACEALIKAEIRYIDLGRVLNRYFINSVGTGFDAAVAHRVNKGVKPLKGLSAYIYSVVITLMIYRVFEMEIALPDETISARPMLVGVGIGKSYGGGMMIVPDALLDDGLFDICIFDQLSKPALLYHFPKVFSGSHVKLKQACMYRADQLVIRTAVDVPLHMEGEIFFGREMHFTLKPKGMPVLVGPGL